MSFSALGRGVEDIHCEVAGAGADVRCCVLYMVLIAFTVWIEEFESMQTCTVTSNTGGFLVDGLCGEFGLVAVRV